MLVPLFFLAVTTSSGGLHLPETRSQSDPTPAEGISPTRTLSKRHANYQGTPSWGFLPIFAAPPVIQIHHIIELQSPDRRCFPSPFPGQPSAPPTQAPMTPNNGGIDSRFGDTNDTTPAANQPSPCVWAIVACCSPGNTNIRYSCFELLGCQGAFWDLSPCEPRVVQAAANTALMFYMAGNPVKNDSNVIDFDPPDSPSTEGPS